MILFYLNITINFFKRHDMQLFIPSSLDLTSHLVAHPTFSGFEKEKLLYIIHCIVNIPNNNKNITVINGFVPLSSKALQDIIPTYKLYLNYGLSTGLFACDGHYVAGEKCKNYKILLPYGTDLKSFELQTYHMKKSYNQHIRKLKKSLKGYEFLERWFSKGLEFDVVAAKRFLVEESALKAKHLHLWDSKQVYNYRGLDVDGTKGVYEAVYKDPFLQYQQGNLSIIKMESGSYSCTISDNGKRLHSVLTNMRSILRNFLSFKNERLVSIDIKNSQPYLIALLLQPSFWESKKIKKETVRKDVFFRPKVAKKVKGLDIYIPLFSTTINNNSAITIDSLSIHKQVSYFMLLDIKKTLMNTSFDSYIESVKNGVFYDDLQQRFATELGVHLMDRKEVKQSVFQVLFTPNQFYGQKQAQHKRLFAKLYPEVYAVLKSIKKKDATLLPLLLQEIESYIMLKVVAKRMQKHHPKVPIFTIHDSIVTTASNQMIVEQVMRDALTEYVGYAPTLSIENLDPQFSEDYLKGLRDRAKQISA
jgi:hypothetical protein